MYGYMHVYICVCVYIYIICTYAPMISANIKHLLSIRFLFTHTQIFLLKHNIMPLCLKITAIISVCNKTIILLHCCVICEFRIYVCSHTCICVYMQTKNSVRFLLFSAMHKCTINGCSRVRTCVNVRVHMQTIHKIR